MNKPTLLALPLADLTRVMTDLGEKPFRARQLWQWFYHRYETDFDAMTDLSKPARALLRERFHPLLPELVRVEESRLDPSRKFLLRFPDGESAEAVFMAHQDRTTLCLSTQTGCALGCAFCLTGSRTGRNLMAAELVGQFLTLVKGLPAERINIVFMGMGEPLLNVENLAAALPFLNETVAPKRITVSTAGVLRGIAALGRVKPLPRLALSLNAGTDATRKRLMPVHTYMMRELFEAMLAYPRKPGERITLEYVLIKGVNDTDAELKGLFDLLRPHRRVFKVNLIPYNAVPGLPYEEPDEARVDAVAGMLAERDVTVTVRRSLGRDIRAACGQLAAEQMTSGSK
jgi:23S rRNA (adenine2503-C2)-methyltransferase